MKGLKDEPTARTIIDEFRIYYNFIRPHMSLKGQTPTQKVHVGSNLSEARWLSLIKKASEYQRFETSS